MAQTFHKFKAESFEQAYQAMRRKLGDEAVVIRTTTVTEGGVFGFLGQKLVELTASAPERPQSRRLSPAERRYLQTAAGGNAAPARAVAAEPKPGSDERVKDTVAYFQKLVRDAQSRIQEESPPAAAPRLDEGPPRNAPEPRTTAQPARRDPQPQPQPQTEGTAAVAPIIPFKRPEPAKESEADLRNDVREMREMLQVLFAEIPGAGLPSEFMPTYHHLVDSGMTRQAAAAMMAEAIQRGDRSVMRDSRVLNERLKMEIRKSVRVTGGVSLSSGVCRRVALVGATGVGKTTNLAKMAALFAVRERARVAMVTADTYRVAAPEQLRVYANIIGLDLEVVNEPREMAAAVRRFREHDLVLIDTAGGSPYNDGQLREMADVVTAAQPDDVMLVVSAQTPLEDMRTTLSRFSMLQPTSLLFTKLDETRRFGALVTLAAESGLPLSYLSTGQNVPDDLVLAHAGMLADMILENGESRGRASSKTA